MPWCDTCRHHWEDAELTDDGACPTCGEVVDEPRGVPWHFKVLIGGTAVYLLYRLVQGIVWLVHHV